MLALNCALGALQELAQAVEFWGFFPTKLFT